MGFFSLRLVVALGGNAISDKSGRTDYAVLVRNIKRSVRNLSSLLKKHECAVVFGSGPQIGALLLQSELSKKIVPPMPLDVLDAMQQGWIGYLLGTAIANEVPGKMVVSVLSQSLVEKNDPSFRAPSKPVGPFYSKKEAKILSKKGFVFFEDAGRGYRRVVASPVPLKILESKTISYLLEKNTIVLCAGGGGIPVVKKGNSLQGVEAVIDKDLAACRLALEVRAKKLIILTTVDNAFVFFGTKNQRPLGKISAKEAKRFLKEGHFAKGSMEPKIRAGIMFAESGGETIITSPKNLSLAMQGKAGTIIVP